MGKTHLPRGFRKGYIPGWIEDSDRLYEEFVESGDREITDELIESEQWKIAEMARDSFFNNIFQSGTLPSEFKLTKIVALLKPGKPDHLPSSYCPIALLSATYKMSERVLYNRISHTILDVIPIEQAGFRPNRSCCDSVLALTNFIEKGFQEGLKTLVVFVDLTAAYDTVWNEGMRLKLLKTIYGAQKQRTS